MNNSKMFNEFGREIKLEKKRVFGSGVYSDKMFKCSKCGKLYCTLGALRFYHFNKKGEYVCE